MAVDFTSGRARAKKGGIAIRKTVRAADLIIFSFYLKKCPLDISLDGTGIPSLII